MPNALKELGRFGRSPWLDTIGRGLLRSGELARLIREDGLISVRRSHTAAELAAIAKHRWIRDFYL